MKDGEGMRATQGKSRGDDVNTLVNTAAATALRSLHSGCFRKHGRHDRDDCSKGRHTAAVLCGARMRVCACARACVWRGEGGGRRVLQTTRVTNTEAEVKPHIPLFVICKCIYIPSIERVVGNANNRTTTCVG